ncbi:cobalt-precorrin-6A synthase [Sebaldella termitidis]|jgi:cobalt-precorrin-5B (C1)-methyltransferase|uniref:Cobalt-precorrin-5B C(1)-methyltransferase n=1 Tax=Sebaldella termitidis (strain ATCC 33386 / NCTC 11300) TaxID=526218 RepID=D1AFJ2_SEBTE|nr:cobalt-precorrin-5B (C(1))-methyltransferase CbiD [Sebaldella termitidis]ACZ07877.1 cobalamin biosynthesis protein CbiD [Sebaldella termitidis ATCC 33386]SUI23178.1 cobalt-precorrin-6A synthase [Sebaldella termitidis]
MEGYRYYQGKQLRCGFTTGSAAAAAAQAAMAAFFGERVPDEVIIDLPAGGTLKIEINTVRVREGYTIASVIKDGGDDPDITHGIEIFSKISIREDNKVNIYGGIGVGTVTKPGLPMKVGMSSINPVPMKMIENEVRKELPAGKGVDVEIFVPEGEEIAKRTLNPKLGVLGGISILGTTGIVKPMSEEAFKDSLAIELKMLLAENPEKEVIFVFGNHGKKFIKEKFDTDEGKILVISNFVGFMLDRACEYGVRKIFFAGDLGKFVKVAGGIFHTHSRMSDAKLEILTANALLAGEERKNLLKILNSNTTEEAVNYVTKKETFTLLAEKAKEKCQEYVRRNGAEISVETLIFASGGRELGRSKGWKL